MTLSIQAEHISKVYQIGEIGTGTISRDIERWFAKTLGKEDPFSKIGESIESPNYSGENWSLKDINFNLEEGEAFGLIGHNGAGKSTLLKILSRVTAPTTGSIKVKGRIASLLEVGTGFHPELTGRENIYLNGAILGMRKREITAKFDEIVTFAGVEKYIDTPVKRYSSGMYVRLAFAVAAHLDSEILIVDEVLAVGDAEFQKKCLGRMKDVSKNDGRTVLFVSHNMSAVSQLCNNCLLLKDGILQNMGPTQKIIKEYFHFTASSSILYKEWDLFFQPRNNNAKITKVFITDKNHDQLDIIYTNTSININIHYELLNDNVYVGFCLVGFSEEGHVIFSSMNNLKNNFYGCPSKKGDYITSCTIPKNFFNSGIFRFKVILFSENFTDKLFVENVLVIDVKDSDELRGDYFGVIDGYVRPEFQWLTEVI